MRAVLVLGGTIVLCGAIALWYFTSRQPEVLDLRGKDEVSVILHEDGFDPRSIRIDRGTRVTFTTTRDKAFWPASNPHPMHTIYPTFDAGKPITPQESWSYVFTNSGAWGYHDHVRSYYVGVIYVD